MSGTAENIAIGNIHATETEKLNRLQSAFAGQATGGGLSALTPEIVNMLKNKMLVNGVNVASLMPGRIHHNPNDLKVITNELVETGISQRKGIRHIRWEQTQDQIAAKDNELAKDPRSINFCEPRIMISDSEMPFLTNVVVIANPEDAGRLAKTHIKKQPNFTPVFFQSLIATNNNAHWRKQREYLNEVFLPKLSLAKIFPISRARAITCADKLSVLSKNAGRYGVQMHEFYLHEAQAQLQLALFGLDEEFMERTNKPIRDVFSGINPDPNYGKDMCLEMITKVGQNPNYASPTDPEVVNGTKKVHGPLSKSVYNASKDLNLNLQDQFGNMMLILFAGHDTTAHTMTWLTYEMAKNPKYQQKLHEECDAFFKRLNGRPMEYEDCEHLPYLTRCVMETLRFWTAVPNVCNESTTHTPFCHF
jgi:cytochrome P450